MVKKFHQVRRPASGIARPRHTRLLCWTSEIWGLFVREAVLIIPNQIRETENENIFQSISQDMHKSNFSKYHHNFFQSKVFK